MAYKFLFAINDSGVQLAEGANADELSNGIKSVRLVRVQMTNGFTETFRVPDTMKTDADISDWIEKQAGTKEAEMAASIKTSALKV